jgi:hypothetical protein
MSHRGQPTPTPSNSNAPVTALSTTPWQTSRPVSRTPSRSSTRTNGFAKNTNGTLKQALSEDDDDDFDDEDFDEMGDRRPVLYRPTDGRSNQPLLHKDDEERGRTGYSSPDPPERPPLFTRRSTMRSRSPDTQAKLATRKKYTYAAFFLGLSLISFVIQTETAVYIQHELGWDKAYCML